ncbi:MAG: fibronectin type III domain-containing protein, partial [Actinomycetota bacterium]
ELRRTGDGSLSETNRSNQGPDFAVAYAHINACGSVASTLLHEATHTMGAVAQDAWGTDRRGHCADGLDLMCTSGRLCPTLRYDCGDDTYFDPAPRRGEYLYTHWNIAFCINRFISRSGCITQPRNLRASYSGYGVTLHWTGPASTGGAPLQTYEIYRRACKDCPLNRIDTVSGSRRSYTDVNFGFRYEYRVRAINVWQDGGPLSNIAAGGIL